ncbi:MAG: TraR/DksA family transcriptional regulator [Puniceicoccaceae bacterium]
MPTKKSAKKTAATTKKKVAKKTAAKKAATKKTAVKKAAKKKTAAKKAAAKKAVSKKAARKPQASDFIKRPSHTPAIFKPSSKRPAHILFTMEDVREVLKKRPKDEEPAKKAAQKKTAKKAAEPKAAQPEKASKHHAASLDDILGLSPSPGSKKAGPDNVPRKFQKYHKLLIELRDHVREELNLHSNDTLKRSQKEDAGDISISVDAGTDNFDRDFALSLLSSEQESLKEIEAAIERIYDGNYGYCEVTGEAIKPERLEAVPFTRFSLEGQRQHESNSYKRTSRAGAFLNEASGEPITFGDDDGDN